MIFGVFTSCNKKTSYTSCDSAVLSVKNGGTFTYHYSWNSSAHDKILSPGATIYYTTGPVNTDPKNPQSQTVVLSTNAADYTYKISQCGTTGKELN